MLSNCAITNEWTDFPDFTSMSAAIDDLRKTIARLRAPGGCPWDIEQTHASLVRCLIDEVSELIDTIDRHDHPHMREELGDVLIQILFHAQIASETGAFDLEDVAREVNEKLIRRHPHVFGADNKLATPADVLVKWEEIKAREKKNGPAQTGLFKEQPPRLPALMYAEAIWKQIGKIGEKNLPVGDAADAAQIRAIATHLDDERLGRHLFQLAAAARERGLDPEGALRRETDRIKTAVERNAEAANANGGNR
ncbi:MAG: MazG family protein [Opitutaceae bacterium]|jgi:XTP/dITP diphosphohydrolase/tetrapyrrole methylase family protein/MazG family protein|nr:MazG family protein [Opitutaceae bacterium]